MRTSSYFVNVSLGTGYYDGFWWDIKGEKNGWLQLERTEGLFWWRRTITKKVRRSEVF